MLAHTICLAPVLLNVGPLPARPSFLQAVPSGSPMVIVFPDLASALEETPENAYLELFSPPGTGDGLIERIVAMGGEEPDDEIIEEVTAILEHVEAASGFMAASPDRDFEFPAGGLSMRVDGDAEEFVASALERLTSWGVELELAEADRRGLAWLRGAGEDGEAPAAVVTVDDVVVLVMGDEPEIVQEHAAEVLERLSDPGMPSIESHAEFYELRDRAVDSAHVELYIDLQYVMQAAGLGAPKVDAAQEVLDDLGGMLASLRAGPDNDAVLSFQVEIGTGNVLEKLLDSFRPVSSDLFHHAPDDCMAIGAAGLDILGMIEVVMEFIEEVDPQAKDAAMDAIETYGDQLGFHLIDDLATSLSGEIVFFQRDLDTYAVPGVDLGEVFTATLLLGLDDADDFFECLDSLLSSTGLYSVVESDEYDGRDTLTWHMDDGTSVYATCLDDAFVLTGSEEDLRLTIDAAGDEEAPSILDVESFEEAFDEVEFSLSFNIMDLRALRPQLAAALEAARPQLEASESIEDADTAIEDMLERFSDEELLERCLDGMFIHSAELDDGVISMSLSVR